MPETHSVSSTHPFPEPFRVNRVSVHIFWSGSIRYIAFNLFVHHISLTGQLDFPFFISCKIERKETGDNADDERNGNRKLKTRHGQKKLAQNVQNTLGAKGWSSWLSCRPPFVWLGAEHPTIYIWYLITKCRRTWTALSFLSSARPPSATYNEWVGREVCGESLAIAWSIRVRDRICFKESNSIQPISSRRVSLSNQASDNEDVMQSSRGLNANIQQNEVT